MPENTRSTRPAARVRAKRPGKPHRRVSKAQKKKIVRRRRLALAGVAAAFFVVFFCRMAWYPITGGQLRAFGWQGETSFAEVWQINHLLRKYHITSRPSLSMFFATAASESGYGRHTLEAGDAAYYEAHGYRAEERGAGYLQLTHREEQLAFLAAMGDDFDGTDTAVYIAEHYAWESACWEWSVGKTSPAPNPNAYAKARGASDEVFLATQYGINGWTIADSALRAIVEGEPYTVSADGTTVTVLGQTAPTPIGWTDRLAAYEKASAIWG